MKYRLGENYETETGEIDEQLMMWTKFLVQGR